MFSSNKLAEYMLWEEVGREILMNLPVHYQSNQMRK